MATVTDILERARAATTVEVLDRAECLALLATERLGRVAVQADPGVGPHVVPVNYALVRGRVVMRVAPGTKFDRLVTEPVTFEVDNFDSFRRVGWSVVVEGFAEEASDEEMAVEEVNFHSLLDMPDSRWVRLVPRSITGRRLAAGRTVPAR